MANRSDETSTGVVKETTELSAKQHQETLTLVHSVEQ